MTGPTRRPARLAAVVDIGSRGRPSELEVAQARIGAAKALHAPCHGPDAPDLHSCRCEEPVSQVVPYCVRDLEQWPCSDWRALTGEPS